jgi:hypothetical protein
MSILHGPMRLLIGAAIVTAALGHALGLGDGGTAPAGAAPSSAVSAAGAAGADLVVTVGYNAGWRGPILAQAGAYAYIESGFRPTAVSSTGCKGLWQLCPPPADAFDPQANARHAYEKWRRCRGGSFDCDWTPYDQGTANRGWAAGYALAQKAMTGLPNGGQ